MMIPVSSWYTLFGNYTFPTVFVLLSDAEIEALLEGARDSEANRQLISKMDYVINHLPGAAFVHADCCAPTDSATFAQLDGGTKVAQTAWKMLRESEKVRAALRSGDSKRICFHPFRRMDHAREFRIFVKGRAVCAISQRYLSNHHPRLESRREEIWRLSHQLMTDLGEHLPADDLAVDVYMTATGRMMVIDLNPWGEPTDPLLLRDWTRNWDEDQGVKLVPKPMRLRGDISLSF